MRVVLVEGGLAWAAALGWRMDRQWNEIEAGTAAPEARAVRIYPVQRLVHHAADRGTRAWTQLAEAIEWIGWDRVLFATDYPHWDFDDPAQALPIKLTEAQKRAVFLENAKAVYRQE